MTYMMLLLRNEIPIINIQLGMIAKAQKKYPRGTARPFWAKKPSNGWKTPSYGGCSFHFFEAWRSVNVLTVVVVVFKALVRTSTFAGGGRTSKI